MARKKDRIDTSGGDDFGAQNPFAALDLGPASQLPPAPPARSAAPAQATRGGGNGQRLEVRRLKGGKGGKTVTEVRGFLPSSRSQLPDYAKALKSALGVGGAVKGDLIEVQGDNREAVAAFFRERGFRPVLAGG